MIQNMFRVRLAEKEHVEGRSWSYRDVAAATGQSRNTVAAWHNNAVKRFDIETLDAFCAFLNCTPGDLLVYIPDPALPSPSQS